MSDWTDGYITEIGYTFGFFRELSPAMIGFVALAKGIVGIDPARPLAYCELGCGQGVSANIIAAALPQAEVHATDFNPSHIAGAKLLATEAGTTNVHFHDQDFATFVDEPSLPRSFDIIAFHGIYSWINPTNRRAIVDFIGRKLRPGGFVYVSYNALPGWAAAEPLRRLLYDLRGSAETPVTSRVDAALLRVEAMVAAKAGYFVQNPSVVARLQGLRSQGAHYLAHEYFNRTWTPFHVADVAGELSDVKLSFVGSATCLDHIDAIDLTPEQGALLSEVNDPIRRESLRDYLVNQQFRRDIFARGHVAYKGNLAREAWTDLRFALSTPAADVPRTVVGARGEASLNADTYGPILDVLAKGPATPRDMFAEDAIAKLGWAKFREALTVLVGMGHLHPALPSRDDALRAVSTRAFNAAVLKRAQFSDELQYLASPVTGSGHALDRVSQLFLAAYFAADPDPAGFAARCLAIQGQTIVKAGKAMESADETLCELTQRLTEFTAGRLPILRQLQIA